MLSSIFLPITCWVTLVLLPAFGIASPGSYQAPSNKRSFLPAGLALGRRASTSQGGFNPFHLDQQSPVATLDYGYEVAGYPFFDIKSVSGPVQIEVKYSEEILGLDQPFSDGPFPFAVALANTYRVETYEIKKPGRIDAFLLQGGQRWQSIRLLTKGSVTFSSVGFVPSIPVVDIDNLPGRFVSDDEKLNDIWKLGARAAVVSCVEAGSQNTMWEIDSKSGAYVRGMRAGTSVKGTFFENYTLEFDTKIDKGGIGWTVAFPVASPARGIQLNLVADEQPYVNANQTIFRPNTVVLGYGYSFVNVTTLTSWHLDNFDVPFKVRSNKWYRLKTVLDERQNLAVSIDGTKVFNVTLRDYPVGDTRNPGGIPDTLGSWGFGGWQDQAGWFRNVLVYDTMNGTELYRNSMTDSSDNAVIREYGVNKNRRAACFDGPKRDRLIWLGDFLHTMRIIGTSTTRYDLARDTLQTFIDWQTPEGLMPYAPPIGYNPDTDNLAFARGGGRYFGKANDVYEIILPDYQILGVLGFTEYVRRSNDLAFAEATWDGWKSNLGFATNNINSTTGLLQLIGAFLGPSNGGSAVNCALVEALRTMAHVAQALKKDVDAKTYESIATKLEWAINEKLWNEKLGIYGLSTAEMNDFSVPSMAFCITSGIASPSRVNRFLSSLFQLKLKPGYKDSTKSNSSDPATNLSPNTNGFLLSALMAQETGKAAETTLELIKSLWTPMLSNQRTNTGTSWEYVNQDEGPGLGLFTSLSHPWGGAPTYILTEWVAGIQAARGTAGFGYRNWNIMPSVGVQMGLKDVHAKVVTAFKGHLEVHWQIKKKTIHVTIWAPKQTTGFFKLGKFERKLSGSQKYSFKVPM